MTSPCEHTSKLDALEAENGDVTGALRSSHGTGQGRRVRSNGDS